MPKTIQELKVIADNGKHSFAIGAISKESAIEMIKTYVDEFNKKAIEIAEKYNQKPKTITYLKYLRSR